MKFSNLIPGDTFNLSSYRGTKINDTECIIVDSSLYEIGDLVSVRGDPEVIPISTYEQSRIAIVALSHLEVMGNDGISWRNKRPYWNSTGEYL